LCKSAKKKWLKIKQLSGKIKNEYYCIKYYCLSTVRKTKKTKQKIGKKGQY